MFRRAYQKAARGVDQDLAGTCPSRATLFRWVAGRVKQLPYPDHCAVLEAMLPGWTAAELFQPCLPPEDVVGSTLLRELLRRRCLHNYQEFCRAYDLAAATIDPRLVGGYPVVRQFHRWICGELAGLPHPEHCTVLEVLFPGYCARDLFELTEPPVVEVTALPEPASPGEPATAAPNGCSQTSPNGCSETSPNGRPEISRDSRPEISSTAGLVLPDQALASAVTALTALALPEQIAVVLLRCLEALASSLVTPRERDRAYHEFVQVFRRWAHTMDRRDALHFLYRVALTASTAATLDGDEHDRLVSVLSGSSRVDTRTIEHIEAVLGRCQRQDHALGPHAALDTVLAQRRLARSLLPQCPAELRPRLLSVVSESSRQAGWLSFDLNQFDDAGYYYEDARARAHEAQNIERGAFVLCEMSHLATWRGMPRTGIDHAVAAQQWAGRSGDRGLRAYTFDVAARAYAADRQRDACLTALDAAHAALPAAGDHSVGSVISFPDEATHIGIRGLCHLELHDPQRAVDYVQQTLGNLDPSAVRNMAFLTVVLGTAYLQCEEIDEAARLLGDAGELAVGNSSARLTERLQQARAQLQPWHGTNAVRELDDRLTTYGLA
ncbi:MAG: hypothetical protein ACT4NY_05240 [Pseudonocardiales bacterium]